jgi:hypothetical protein
LRKSTNSTICQTGGPSIEAQRILGRLFTARDAFESAIGNAVYAATETPVTHLDIRRFIVVANVVVVNVVVDCLLLLLLLLLL